MRYIFNFFLRPASHEPLAALRIATAAVLLLQALFIAPEFFEFFGSNGVMQDSLQRFFSSPGSPTLAPYLRALGGLGVSEKAALAFVGGLYVYALACLMVGFFTRTSAVVSWFLHWTLTNTGACANYGADTFAHIFLFYLIFIPSGKVWSIDSLYTLSPSRSWAARLSLRILQFHLCLVYFSSALDKAVGPQWQNGEVMWRALMLPIYNQFDFTWLPQLPWLAKILAWGSLATEFGYALFIWPKLTRKLWVALTVGLHLGIAVFLGLHVFGFIMAGFTAALFGISAEKRPKTKNILARSSRLMSFPELAYDIGKR
jgi:hypothetical protein